MQVTGANAATQFWTWWINELTGFVPARPGRAAERPPVALRIFPDSIEIGHSSSQPCPVLAKLNRDPEQIKAEFERIARKIADKSVAVSISSQLCLARKTTVPLHAQNDALEISLLDLEASSPLRSSDVYLAIQRDGATAERSSLEIRSLVVKRSVVDPILEILKEAGFEVPLVDAFDSETGRILPAQFAIGTPHSAPRTSRTRRLVTALLTICLMSTAVLVWFDRQEKEIIRLATLADAVKEQAARLRRDSAERERRIAQAMEVAKVHSMNRARLVAMNELSRLLPDMTWLTDLDIEDEAFLISGYSKAAAGLVSLIDSSSYFDRAQLTAPIVFEDSEGKERFSIRFSLEAKRDGDQAALMPTQPAPNGNIQDTGNQQQ